MPTLAEFCAGFGLIEGILTLATAVIIVLSNDAGRIKRKLKKER